MACRIKARVVRKRSGGKKDGSRRKTRKESETDSSCCQLSAVYRTLEMEMSGTEAVCVRLGCVLHQHKTVVLLSPEQATLRLSKFPLANNNSTQVRNEARLKVRTHPGQNEGV